MKRKLPSARLQVILARDTPKAVIIRRGPTEWARLSLWHTDSDSFEHGQWFKGHIYADRCDLSPDGSLLIYFAAKWNAYTLAADTPYDTSWIAISKPPYLTALALWNCGTTYCHGGLFEDNRTVWLPFNAGMDRAHPQHQPQGLKIVTGKPLPTHTYFYRLERDGWHREAGRDAVPPAWWVPKRGQQSIYWTKPAPGRSHQLVLERVQVGYEVSFTYFLADRERQSLIALTDVAWADWDQRGRLTAARHGQIVAMNPNAPYEDVSVLADVNDQRPNPQPAPEWAQHW